MSGNARSNWGWVATPAKWGWPATPANCWWAATPANWGWGQRPLSGHDRQRRTSVTCFTWNATRAITEVFIHHWARLRSPLAPRGDSQAVLLHAASRCWTYCETSCTCFICCHPPPLSLSLSLSLVTNDAKGRTACSSLFSVLVACVCFF